jgi:hypothetical protein
MTDKKRLKKIMSPIGVAIYPHITKPDFKFNSDGVYDCRMRLENNQETQDFFAILQQELDEYLGDMDKKKRASVKKILPFYTDELDSEGEPTGKFIIKFKLNALIKSGEKTWNLKPRIWSASNQLIEGEALDKLQLWGGSLVRIKGEINPFFSAKDKEAGLSLRMGDVQIKKAVAGGGSPFDAFEGEDDVPPSDAEAAPFDDEPQDGSSTGVAGRDF